MCGTPMTLSSGFEHEGDVIRFVADMRQQVENRALKHGRTNECRPNSLCSSGLPMRAHIKVAGVFKRCEKCGARPESQLSAY
jgi:hypothetical protein